MTDISIRIYSALTSALSSLKREEGQDLIEYALLGGLIAVGITLAVAAGIYTNAIDAMAGGIKNCIDFAPGGCPASAL